MALYVHITDRCEEDAKRLNLEQQLSSAREAILTTQNLSSFSFLSSVVLKKKIGRPFRLIAWQHTIADDQLIIFIRILQRRVKDYPILIKDIGDDPKHYTDYTDAKLKKIHARLTSASSPYKRPPTPNDEERAWLENVFREKSPGTDTFVFETQEWVDAMRNNNMAARYNGLLDGMTDPDRLKPAEFESESDGVVGIAYYYRPDLNSILLLEPFRGTLEQSLSDKYAKKLSDIEDLIGLSRLAARSYPFLIALDPDKWLMIQSDNESNLALSPEEADIIESIHASKLSYPLFVNGLAGSGKSTILQYLASTYIDFSLRRNTHQLPLYLTASEDLLEGACRTVKGLITTNHDRILNESIDPDTIDRLLDSSFQTFHRHLYALLPAEYQQLLRRDRYVNYASFRRLWGSTFVKRPEARQLSVEVSWHVIRSLIKGIRSHWDEELTPEDFVSLPRRRRSVSPVTFEKVYDVVWNKWYRRLCKEDGYWDDQDLSAYVLGTSSALNENRSAIFCDEAQDFTSADLDVLFQLSLYSRRTLRSHELRRVPIIFAGDPLQTINPTGFRWSAVKADFHDRFRATLEVGSKSGVEMSYRDLSYNYRSDPGIVRFCNLLQLARSALLKVPDICPQDSWRRADPVPPMWFPLDDPETSSHLRDHPEFVKLIDCHEGEETEYVENDPTLRRIVDQSEEGTYWHVMCPTRVKGLEFSTVVLYRFGERMANELDHLLNDRVDLEEPEKRLPWEYFFNRLYVAASRAKDRLIVVDSEHAIDRFWKIATNPEIPDRLEGLVHDVWKGTYAGLLHGTPEAWDAGHIDQRAQAKSYADQGERDRDPYLLRQAGLSYQSLDEDFHARRYFARAAELEEKWSVAGDRYREIRRHEDAHRCYWSGQLWRPLKELPIGLSKISRIGLESRAADFMESGDAPTHSFLKLLCSAVNDEARLQEISSDATWHRVLSVTAERVSETADDIVVSWINLLEAFDRLVRNGVLIKTSILATIAYRAKNFEKAVELWEEDDNQLHLIEYKRAKANITPFPDCLEFYKQLGDHAEILRRWKSERPSDSVIRTLSPQIAYAVADAALDQGELALVAAMMQQHPSRERIGRLVAAAVKRQEDHIICDGAVTATRLFIRSRAWKDAVDADSLVSISKLSDVPNRAIRAALNRMERSTEILKTVVWELAISDDLVDEAPSVVALFLQRRFIGSGASLGTKIRDHDLPVVVIGAAIERSGKIVDALQYYENLLKDSESNSATKKFAAERLVRNLERHARYIDIDRRGNSSQATQQRDRAEKLRKDWRIGNRDLDDYPQVKRPTEKRTANFAPIGELHSFWDSPTLEALARSQNVEPVANVEDLFGTWPGDESDGFEDAIDALRNSDSGDATS